MQAIVCKAWGPPEDLVLESVVLPALQPGQVRIRVRAAGVNFPDVLIVQKKYQQQPALPFTPGNEVAGEVIEVASDVVHLRPGDAVVSFCNLGGFAEEVIAPADATHAMAPGLSFETAAAFTLTYGTSWHALCDRAALKAGETVLVLGASGGVGLAAIEIARAVGARVIAAASSADKLALCREHGADALINYEEEDLREAIKRHTNGRGPDVVFDPVGGKYAEPAFRSIAWRGRYLVVGFANGQIPAVPWNLALLKSASLVGVFWGEFVRREPLAHEAGMASLLGWLSEGRLRPHVSRTYTLAETAQALIDLRDRRATGKLVIVP
ncbi:NADPH:quinone oxidoreductase family protein [Pigmentiphaga aceris]|uniref:NADPH:quinone oxidoreductase family protein n=1 Tax=Pigmentiphaga aceris TaxID=1940612 RepID=A0A5C0AZV8_9BURK|nr:NADPH:quinone oxidoreductase family protein [Pigmentiphaga aceris]QEI06121.1 NADPH:quinone oxidoreductase family protein [Pigmentiphaga aceris]